MKPSIISQKSGTHLKRLLLPFLLATVPSFLFASIGFFLHHSYLARLSSSMSTTEELLSHKFALDQSTLIQYFTYLKQLLNFDLGPTPYYKDLPFTVADIISTHLRNNWIVPLLLLIFTIVLIPIHAKRVSKKIEMIVFALFLLSFILSIPTYGVFFIILYLIQASTIGFILIRDVRPRLIGAIFMFFFCLQIPVFDFIIRKVGIYRNLLHYGNIYDTPLYLGSCLMIVIMSSLLTLFIYYLCLLREFRSHPA